MGEGEGGEGVPTSGHSVEDRLWGHALATRASKVWFVSRDHLPQNNTETVHVTAWSVVGT